MNKLALIRLIAWSILAVVLICILIGGLRGKSFFETEWISFGPGLRYNEFANSDRYTLGAGSVSADEVSEIVVGWIDGSVEVVSGVGGDITFSEQSNKELAPEYEMRYYVSGGKLYIQYCQSRASLRGARGSLKKNLKLTVPEGVKMSVVDIDAISSHITFNGIPAGRLTLNTVTGDIDIANTVCDKVSLETVSGRISADNAQANTLKADSVSGSVELKRSALYEAKCETVSGAITVEPGALSKSVDLETVSGALCVRIPENKGFSAHYSTVSGGFSCDFPVTTSKNNASYLDGEMEIDFSSVSGSFQVGKAG